MLRQLFDAVYGKYQKSKKIATDSNYLRCHALLTVLHFPLETTWSCKQDRAVLGTTILANGKGHFGPTDRNDQTGHSGPPSKLVPRPFHLMYRPKLPEFWVEWKAPLLRLILRRLISAPRAQCPQVPTDILAKSAASVGGLSRPFAVLKKLTTINAHKKGHGRKNGN